MKTQTLASIFYLSFVRRRKEGGKREKTGNKWYDFSGKAKKDDAYGWETFDIDGHDLDAVENVDPHIFMIMV